MTGPKSGDRVTVNLPEGDAMHGWNGSVGTVRRVEDGMLWVEGAGFGLWADATQVEPASPGPQSGDFCSFGRGAVPAHYITHYRCDDYADGAIVDGITGKIITPAKPGAPRGFKR